MTGLFKAVFSGLLLLSAECFANQATWIEPVTDMPFVNVPKGCFQMGSTADAVKGENASLKPYYQQLTNDEQPQHEVCVDSFWLAQFEVRASDWQKVFGRKAPSGHGDEPVGSISYKQAQVFAQKLTEQSKGKSKFRLPTEAEWEYACLANEEGEELPFHSNKVDMAWYSVEGKRALIPSVVGKLKANAWGLYDMLGNVWEWVEDSYQVDGYRQHALYNPVVKDNRSQKVIRGASHRSEYVQLRCSNRSSYFVTEKLPQIGFRLVREYLEQ